ncbi:MAG: hypothetical protein KDA99_02900, partial [Planctomycetales bacterium]|nr:hypothetical protein [Planctomycetales bacterium]
MNVDGIEVEKRKSRTKWLIVWLIAAVPVMLISIVILDRNLPSPPLVVSKATTRITSPLDKNGLPDYVAYLRALESEGVTAENNAAIPLWRAMWPGDLDAEYHEPFCKALGMSVPTYPDVLGEQYTAIFEQIEGESQDESEDDADGTYGGRGERIDDLMTTTCSAPWTTEQVPKLARWLQANQERIDLLVDAGHREKYYSPTPQSTVGSQEYSLIETLMPDVNLLRNAARILSCRAMWHAGEGRSAEAWRDLEAAYGIAQHSSGKHTLVQQLVGGAIEGMAANCLPHLLHESSPSAELAREILGGLQSRPLPMDLAKSIDIGERSMCLDALKRMAVPSNDGASQFGMEDLGVDYAQPLRFSAGARMDWNQVFRNVNGWYDRIMEVTRLPRDEREAALAQLEADFQSTEPSPVMMAFSLVNASARTEALSAMFAGLFIPAITSVTKAEVRQEASRTLSITAAALAVFRAENGKYPESLDAIVPSIVSTIPLDPYSGQPPIYQRRGDGYLLYSVFENKTDDGGDDPSGEIINGEWVSEEADVPGNQTDMVIRVPR